MRSASFTFQSHEELGLQSISIQVSQVMYDLMHCWKLSSNITLNRIMSLGEYLCISNGFTSFSHKPFLDIRKGTGLSIPLLQVSSEFKLFTSVSFSSTSLLCHHNFRCHYYHYSIFNFIYNFICTISWYIPCYKDHNLLLQNFTYNWIFYF